MPRRGPVTIRDVSARRWLQRLSSIADQPGDDDDARLRKHSGVIIGYITIVVPFALPLTTNGLPIAWALAIGLSAFSALSLLVLKLTRNFDRFVMVLIAVGTVFTIVANVLQGGVTGATAGLVWAFLSPVYAIISLGPRRAKPWFWIFLFALIVAAVTDPLARGAFAPPSYLLQRVGFVQNIGIPLTIAFLLLRNSDLRRREAEARSEELLHNAIPSSIALRLKRGEKRIADAHADTTVLFSDIVGFTPWAQRTDPDRVVEMLDDLFTRFDTLADACGVEKIKTIGDSYMAVAGAPDPRPDHAVIALQMAMRMLEVVATWRDQHRVELQVRIGLASGPIVAGVIGHRRILFDVWGDTVNAASRMESSGLAGRIQVTHATHTLTRDRYSFEKREVQVKGLGAMTTYLLAETEDPD